MTGAFSLTDVDPPKGQFSAADLEAETPGQTPGSGKIAGISAPIGDTVTIAGKTFNRPATDMNYRLDKWFEKAKNDLNNGTDDTGVGKLYKSLGGHGLNVGGPQDFLPHLANATYALFGGAATAEGLGNIESALRKLPNPADEWREINAVMKIRPSQVRMPAGAAGPEDAYNMPGRSVLQKTGLTADKLKDMDPFEQGAAIKPHWRKAGQEVAGIADAATKAGKTFDVGKGLTDAIENMASPQLQDRAIKTLSDTARELGIQDWRTATPNDALKLRQALWDNLPSGYRSPLYGVITRNLKGAVPELVPADQTYSELSAAMEGAKRAAQKFAVSAPDSSWLQKAGGEMRSALKNRLVQTIGAGAAGTWALKKLGWE